MLGWIVGLGVLASYCIRFYLFFEFSLGRVISPRVSADGGFWFRVVFFYLFFEFGYFILKYQRSMVFGSHMGALVRRGACYKQIYSIESYCLLHGALHRIVLEPAAWTHIK